MNANEVIANRGNALAGKKLLHPLFADVEFFPVFLGKLHPPVAFSFSYVYVTLYKNIKKS